MAEIPLRVHIIRILTSGSRCNKLRGLLVAMAPQRGAIACVGVLEHALRLLRAGCGGWARCLMGGASLTHPALLRSRVP
jgi:hypothetical protein